MPVRPRLLSRLILRAIVFVEMALLMLVAVSVRELVGHGKEVEPLVVLVVAAMLGAAVVALRATFRDQRGDRGYRVIFMGSQAVAAVLPILAFSTLRSFVAEGSPAPTSGGYDANVVIGFLNAELLLAAVLAAVSAMLAPLLLPPPRDDEALGLFSRALVLWSVGGLIVVLLVGAAYGLHFADSRSPHARVSQLLDQKDGHVRWVALRNLLDMDLAKKPEARALLYEGLDRPDPSAQAHAAFVLIAAGVDDGRAIEHLRSMVGGKHSAIAVQTLSRVGPKATVALPEIEALVYPVPTSSEELRQTRQALRAIGAMGPAAAPALPTLLSVVMEKEYTAVRRTAAEAVDAVDPGFAGRCVVGASTLLEGVQMAEDEIPTLEPGCEPGERKAGDGPGARPQA